MADECRLCLARKPLRRSHIFPEFLFRLVYDNTHRFETVHLDSASRSRSHQKGFRERLLCADCEQVVGRYERYASTVLVQRSHGHLRYEDQLVVIDGIDYARFKLFLLSLLWRAGVSRLSEFADVQLGDDEEALREMILRGQPGRFNEFPSILSAFTRHSELFASAIVPPTRIEIHSLVAYRTMFASLICTTFVVREVAEERAHRGVMREDGTLPIRILSSEAEERILRDIAYRLPLDVREPEA